MSRTRMHAEQGVMVTRTFSRPALANEAVRSLNEKLLRASIILL